MDRGALVEVDRRFQPKAHVGRLDRLLARLSAEDAVVARDGPWKRRPTRSFIVEPEIEVLEPVATHPVIAVELEQLEALSLGARWREYRRGRERTRRARCLFGDAGRLVGLAGRRRKRGLVGVHLSAGHRRDRDDEDND